MPQQSEYRPNPTQLEALVTAVNLPKVYSTEELRRTLIKHNADVMAAAVFLRKKYEWRKKHDTLNLNIGLIHKELSKGYFQLLDNAYDHEKCPIVVFKRRYFIPTVSNADATVTKAGAIDKTTNLKDAFKVFTYVLDLAVKEMERKQAPGVVYIVDMEDCVTSNFDQVVDSKLFKMIKKHYPDTLYMLYALNGNAITRGIGHVGMKMLSNKSRKKVKILSDDKNHEYETLTSSISSKSIPEEYGGRYRMQSIESWIRDLAEDEHVDISDTVTQINEQKLLSKEAATLNGMQYSGCSALEVSTMKATSIRGPLWRKRGDSTPNLSSSINVFGVGWTKVYGILRPDAILIYADLNSKRPDVIIPLIECTIRAQEFPNQPRGASGFAAQVSMTTHMMAAFSEEDRRNWLKEADNAIAKLKSGINEKEHERRLEEKVIEEAKEKLELISLWDDVPVTMPSSAANIQVKEIPVYQAGQNNSNIQPQLQELSQASIPTIPTQQNQAFPSMLTSIQGGNPSNLSAPTKSYDYFEAIPSQNLNQRNLSQGHQQQAPNSSGNMRPISQPEGYPAYPQATVLNNPSNPSTHLNYGGPTTPQNYSISQSQNFSPSLSPQNYSQSFPAQGYSQGGSALSPQNFSQMPTSTQGYPQVQGNQPQQAYYGVPTIPQNYSISQNFSPSLSNPNFTQSFPAQCYPQGGGALSPQHFSHRSVSTQGPLSPQNYSPGLLSPQNYPLPQQVNISQSHNYAQGGSFPPQNFVQSPQSQSNYTQQPQRQTNVSSTYPPQPPVSISFQAVNPTMSPQQSGVSGRNL